MAYYPQNATGLNYISYPVGPNAVGATVTTSASANTKGSYVQFVASTPFAPNAVILEITRVTASTLRGVVVDVATGASGSETVVVPNISYETYNNNTSHTPGFTCYLPLAIASSTRLAIRTQASTGSTDVFCGITLVAAGGVSGIASFTSYGVNTSTSLGVSVDPGGSANTKGAYSQITSSSSAVAQFLAVLISRGPSATGATPSQWSLDLATGAAASEVVLIPDLRVSNSVSGSGGIDCFRYFHVLTYIAASTRLAACASCDITGSTDRLLGVTCLAGVAPAEPSGGGAWAFA